MAMSFCTVRANSVGALALASARTISGSFDFPAAVPLGAATTTGATSSSRRDDPQGIEVRPFE
jgi:hypothetical protein